MTDPTTDAPSITCPVCGRTSWHPEDVRHGYCGACRAVTTPSAGTWQLSDVWVEQATAVIAAAEATAVLWRFDAGGYTPGDFVQALLEAVVRADPTNQARLALGFPGLVAAVQLAQGRTDGIARLRAIAAERTPAT